MSPPNALEDNDENSDLPLWKREAPRTDTENDYKLAFGKNKNLEITECSKVCEAHMHNQHCRVTLLYRGLGAYTFRLVESKQLTTLSQWQVYYQD